MASYFVLGADNREYGPVSSEVLARWIAEGRVLADTKLRIEGGNDWRAAREFPEIAPLVVPRFVTPPPLIGGLPSGVREPAELLATREFEPNIGEWIGKAWKFYLANWGEILGYSLLTQVLQFAAGMMPCGLGALAQFFAIPMLGVGLFHYLIKKWRGLPTDLIDLFAGFKYFYVPTLVANILFFLIMLALWLPLIGGVVMVIVIAVQATFTQFHPAQFVIPGVLALLTIVFGAYWGVSCTFWYMLVADKGLGGWEALQVSRRVVTRHWWWVFLFVVLVSLIGMAGILACGIGLLFTIPFVGCCLVVAYDSIFGPRRTPAAA